MPVDGDTATLLTLTQGWYARADFLTYSIGYPFEILMSSAQDRHLRDLGLPELVRELSDIL